MFITASSTCKTTKAGAFELHPQTTQRALLTRNSQNPAWRLEGWEDATSHVEPTVTAIAGH